MTNVKRILPLAAMLFAFPVFAQPLSLQDAVSADVKAQMYDSQAAETSGTSAATQTENGGPAAQAAEDLHASAPAAGSSDGGAKADSASPATAPEMATNDHAGISTEHPEKPAIQPEPRKAHSVRHGKKKTS